MEAELGNPSVFFHSVEKENWLHSRSGAEMSINSHLPY